MKRVSEKSWARDVDILAIRSFLAHLHRERDGAGIGAIAKGKKGAAVGAAIGGVAGAVCDLATRNKKH